MSTRLYVGNLDYGVDDAKLYEVFSAIGAVRSARVMVDHDTGQSKGFAFVEMEAESDAQRCIQEVNGSDVEGRTVTVNEAKPRGGSGSNSDELSPWLRKMLSHRKDMGYKVDDDGYVSGHRRSKKKNRASAR